LPGDFCHFGRLIRPFSPQDCLDGPLGLGRHLIPGYHCPWWTKRQLVLLGTAPDEEVARRTGRTAEAVRQKREELGIPNPAGNRWTVEEVALLGTMPDTKVASRVARSVSAVTQKRIKLGIAIPSDTRLRSKG
jgi:hypothetical protein